MKFKAFSLLLLLALMSAPAALATEEEITVMTNKDAIDLVFLGAHALQNL